MNTPPCDCTWDRYDLTCPHPYHVAVALRTVTVARLVTSVALSTPCPDYPPQWDDLR
jgi:hypothetical protein